MIDASLDTLISLYHLDMHQGYHYYVAGIYINRPVRKEVALIWNLLGYIVFTKKCTGF
jgi:hypothetical protein